MYQDSKRFEILAWGADLPCNHACNIRCDELTCITRPTHAHPLVPRTRLRALLPYLFTPHPCYLLAPNTPPPQGFQAVPSTTYWHFPRPKPSFDPLADGRHDSDKHARQDAGSNLSTYFLSQLVFHSFSAYLHNVNTSSSLVFEILILQFQLPYKVVPQIFGR